MSAETERLFRELLKELRALFKEAGFRSSSQNFILESPECWVIVNFQKSRWVLHRGQTTFYVNVAATSKRWLGVEGKPADEAPPYYSCDWRWRAEQFGPDKQIKEWTLTDNESLRQTIDYLRRLFTMFVFPATKLMTSEAGLLENWDTSGYPQLKTRAIIFAETNQVDALRQTVAELMEKFGSGPVAKGTQAHLLLLRSKYPEAMHSIE